MTDSSEGEDGNRRSGQRTSRFGRNLAAAIGVGVLLGAVVIASLFIVKSVFVAFVIVAVGLAVIELSRALRPAGVTLPLVPLLAGVVGMLAGAYIAGTPALVGALGLTAFAVFAGRLLGGREGYVRDVTAGVFVALYVPFLASFAILMLRPEDGPFRVLLFVAVTVASDIGGYAAGVLFGRHKLAPEISPGKTWEGLAGSALSCLAVGIVGVTVLLHGAWWAGLVLGVVATVTATAGDLVESMLKRDIGIKDMGSVLPGHGGVMDRLDSLLPTALVSWLVLTLLVAVPG
ncbi:phosphatidate cytidylyltransferase [Actinopolymorpha alba]|uniref:phosphatidate cytidylyltransferase n=1 Tax=Actinopolymorpha alba TaxID=533267 RepID=UPI0012F650D9|nr:phosphatidate cytidylyltransferase [Actinopolymorpha alba]